VRRHIKEDTRAFEPATISNGDAAAFSIGVTQRVIGPLTELSMVAAKENVRLAVELQIVALETYHRGYLEVLDSAQRALTYMATTARLVTQAADRLQTAAMDAGRRVRETLETTAGMCETMRR
jgi:hypothetical protein